MARLCLRCTHPITGPGPKKLCDGCASEWGWCPRCSDVLPRERFTNRGATKTRTAYCALCEYVRHLTTKFGLSDEDARALALVEECQVCEARPLPGDRLHVDHDHATGEIRGVLCRWCNYAVAVLEDDRRTVVEAYLREAAKRHLTVVR